MSVAISGAIKWNTLSVTFRSVLQIQSHNYMHVLHMAIIKVGAFGWSTGWWAYSLWQISSSCACISCACV